MTPSTKIETVTCSRCGGCGRYSWNQITGDRCFKCNGSGVVHTKRGAAAFAYLQSMRSKPCAEVQVGDLVYIPSGLFHAGGFQRVLSHETPDQRRAAGTPSGWSGVEKTPIYQGRLTTEHIGWGYSEGDKIRMGLTAEQKATTLKAALEYQDTLAKTGKPLVRVVTK